MRAYAGALPKSAYLEAAGLAVVLGIVAFFSTYQLTESPAIWYDEGYYVQLAQSQKDFGEMKLQVAPGEFAPPTYVSVGYPLIYPVAASLALFGDSVAASRAVMPLFMAGAVVVSYLFARALWGRKAALLGALLLATFPLLYGNGKTVLGEVPGYFYFVLFLLCLISIQKSGYRARGSYIGGGAALGLALATKPFFLLILPALLVAVVLARRDIVWHSGRIAGAAAAAAAVLLWWVCSQRLMLEVLWLRYFNPYEVDMVRTVLENMLRFFTEATPLYFAAALGLWVVVVGVRLYRKERVHVAEWVALIFVLLVAAAYLRTLGWYRYFFVGHMLALVTAPAALLYIAGLSRYARELCTAAAVVILALCAYQTTQLLSGSFVAEHYGRTTAHDMAAYLETRAGDTAFLYDVPELAILLPDRHYYQYLAPIGGLRYGEEGLEVLKERGVDYAVVRASQALPVGYQEVRMIGGYRIVEPTP